MQPRSPSALLRLLLLVCALGLVSPALTAAVSAGATVPAASPQQAPSPNPNRPAQAQAALDRVERILSGVGPASSQGDHPDLTLALRDLAILKGALGPSDRARAERILARPTDKPRNCEDASCYSGRSKRKCSDVVCVHWVPKKRDRRNGVSNRDRDGDGVPNYVEKVIKTATRVHTQYVAAGYPKPRSDKGRGGNNKPDIYLAQIGDIGLYGYCTTDDRTPPLHGGTWGYCVLDNNYASREFPAHTPIENMKVTVAHEYFHNVQFGMDIGEDAWFMEATATWVEDEVYDKINDNAFYLKYGPMKRPLVPLNTFESNGLYHYGAWIFFRFLTDQYGAPVAGINDLVRRMWLRADGHLADNNALYAIGAVLATEGTTVPEELARFSAGNRQPGVTYAAEVAELAADKDDKVKYPTAPLHGSLSLSPGETATREPTFSHLTARTYRFVPEATLAGDELDLGFDLSDEGAAVVRVKSGSGAPEETVVTADGSTSFHFDPSVAWVEVTLVNGHTVANGIVESVTASAS